MAIWYVDPTATATSDSFDGGFGVGKLRLAWQGANSITWTSGDQYYQRRGTTVTLTGNLTPGGNNVLIGAYGVGAMPMILSPSAATAYGMFFSAGSNVVVQDLHFKMTNRLTGYAGVRIGGTTNFTIRDCVIEGYDIGIPVQASAVNTSILNNVIFDIGDDAITVAAANGGRIFGNSVSKTSQRTTTGDCIQFLASNDWGPWVIDNNRLILEAGSKQCIQIDPPTSATQAAVVIVNNTCASTVNGIHCRHAAIVKNNRITLSGTNAALLANAGKSNQPIIFTGNVVECIGEPVTVDPGSGPIAFAVYSEAGNTIVHDVSIYNNTVFGNVYRGLVASADVDVGTITLRNNLFRHSFGSPSAAISINAGATATFTESNSAVSGFTTQGINFTFTNPVTTAPQIDSDGSLRMPGNPLATAGTYVQGVTLANGRLRPNNTPIGAYMAVQPRAVRA